MDYTEEITKLEGLKKVMLQLIIRNGSHYIHFMNKSNDAVAETTKIRSRQRQRTKDGFILNQHPTHKPGYHSLGANEQFEARQLYEKQLFEHQQDEKLIQELQQQSENSRHQAAIRFKNMPELYETFDNFSRLVYELTHPEAILQNENDTQNNQNFEGPDCK
ncbi:hypothetical protein HK103_004372 [Boothiomyces macroporosus]|uniref:Uncharacterized protein n=1 Tax=Boothiomyces macroporosus TaxID=261099 RepID=A0AAD5XZN1_9FUNG|nr:hypothetical protein HK103_004372 [Boothiomyces macroporosus]